MGAIREVVSRVRILDFPAIMLLVGIDVGMTCTGMSPLLVEEFTVMTVCDLGVAWATPDSMTEPHVIQRWPGNQAEQRDKVRRFALLQSILGKIFLSNNTPLTSR